MINKIKIATFGLGAMLLTLISSTQAHAQAYSTSTAVTSINNLTADVSQMITGSITAILVLLAALLGLGWGVRHFRRYIAGRKF